MNLVRHIVAGICRTAVAVVLTVAPMSLSAEEPRPVDPRVKIARAATETIASAEERVARSHEQILADIRTAFAEVDKALPQLRGDRVEQSAIAMSNLGLAARGLHRLSEGLLAQRDRYEENREALEAANSAAVDPYRNVANAFRQWAREAEYADLKTHYLKTAEIWDVQVQEAEERAAQFEPNEERIQDALEFLEAWAEFLQRFADACDAVPDPRSLTTQKVYLDRLKECVKMIERFKELISEVHRELTAEAVNTALRPAPRPTAPESSQNKAQLAGYTRSGKSSPQSTPRRTAQRNSQNFDLQSFLSAKRPAAPLPPAAAHLAGGTQGYRSYYGVP